MRNPKARVSDPNAFVTDPGSSTKIILSPKVNPDGTVDLVESGKIDIQAKIQSFLPETDINFILAKYAAGDLQILNQREGMYGDFTHLPSTFAEVLQIQIDAEAKFNLLPLDLRNKYDNDYKRWLATAGSEEWMRNMSVVMPAMAEQATSADVNSEVKTDES